MKPKLIEKEIKRVVFHHYEEGTQRYADLIIDINEVVSKEREECANLVEIYRYGNRPSDLIFDLKELAEVIRSREA